MRKSGKTLIAVFIVAGLAFVLYMMSPLSDRYSAKSAVSAEKPVIAVSNGQVTAGSIDDDTASSSTSAGRIVATPKPVAVPNVMLESEPANTGAANQPHPVAPRPQSAQVREATNARKATLAKASPLQPSHNQQAAEGGRYKGDNSVATAMTEALVKQSAQLDPSLPPPTNMPAHDSAASSGATHGGSNAVAAAMTADLVRESSKVNSHAQPSSQTGTR